MAHELIQRDKDEDRRRAMAAGAKGGEEVAARVEDELMQSVRDLPALKGIVTYADVARMYDTSIQTARQWINSLDVEQVRGPKSQTHYYRWEHILEAVG